MQFQHKKMPMANFQFGGPQCLTRFFLSDLLPGVLRECGAAIPGGELISSNDEKVLISKDEKLIEIFMDYIQLGYLLTIQEKLQAPHIDYEHRSIKVMLDKCDRKNLDQLMPWCWDMPQNPNGMRLAVWGTEYPQSSHEPLYQVPMDVNVYGKEVLLRRGE
jgi:hypothetical protein